MSTLNLFQGRGSAPLARERLQILLSHERTAGKQPDLLAVLHDEILATIARQIVVERENVRVRIDRGATVSKKRKRKQSGLTKARLLGSALIWRRQSGLGR